MFKRDTKKNTSKSGTAQIHDVSVVFLFCFKEDGSLKERLKEAPQL